MMVRYWVAVASGDHVALGRKLGIMQVCHGKIAPLRRISSGDVVVYYSPTKSFGGKDRLQAFTAIGTVQAGQPYQVKMSENFSPWRLSVAWREAQDVPIQLLLNHLSFTQNIKNWGYKFRFGLFEMTKNDADLIAKVMETQ